MPLDESRDFTPEPRTQADYLKAIWGRLGDLEKLVVEKVIPRQDVTNGRISSLEKWKFGIVGGLAVVTAVIVPIFVFLVTHQMPK